MRVLLGMGYGVAHEPRERGDIESEDEVTAAKPLSRVSFYVLPFGGRSTGERMAAVRTTLWARSD